MTRFTFKNKFGTGWVEIREDLFDMKTEDWGVLRPSMDPEKCKLCGTCYIICPTGCIGLEGNKLNANIQYCKGCGLCSYECPGKAITMK